MIQQLLEARLITPNEFKLYSLFTSDLGRECFTQMKEELFWEEPSEDNMTTATLGFYEGRRSVLRGIKSIIDKVEGIIHKQNLAAAEKANNV